MIILTELIGAEAKLLAWAEFREHHYSPDNFAIAANWFLAFDEDTLIGVTAHLSFPSGSVSNARISHKVVVLPQYRERWSEVADAEAQMVIAGGQRYFSNASDAPEEFVAYRNDPASGWKPTSKNGKVPRDKGHNSKKFGYKPRRVNTKGVMVSHEYVGTEESFRKALPLY